MKGIRQTKKRKPPRPRPRPARLESFSVPKNFEVDFAGIFEEFGKEATDEVADSVHNDLVEATLEYWTERDRELRGALSLRARREYLRETHRVLKMTRGNAEKLRLLWNEMPAEAERLVLAQTNKHTLARFSSNDFRDSAAGGNCLDEFCRIAAQVDKAMENALSGDRGADIHLTKRILIEHLARAYHSLTEKHPARGYSDYLKDGPKGETGPFYRFVKLFEQAMIKSFRPETEARKERRPEGKFPSADNYKLGPVDRVIRNVAKEFKPNQT
jgi:hypothetical protein